MWWSGGVGVEGGHAEDFGGGSQGGDLSGDGCGFGGVGAEEAVADGVDGGAGSGYVGSDGMGVEADDGVVGVEVESELVEVVLGVGEGFEDQGGADGGEVTAGSGAGERAGVEAGVQEQLSAHGGSLGPGWVVAVGCDVGCRRCDVVPPLGVWVLGRHLRTEAGEAIRAVAVRG